MSDEGRAEPCTGAYWNWLEENGDERAQYVRLMRQWLRVQEELQRIDRLIRQEEPRWDSGWIDIAIPIFVRSPILGRCYTRPTPDAPSFVAVGSRVTPGTVVCLVEAMQLFNEIVAGVHGVVSEIAVANGDVVEYNQVLFRVSRTSLDSW